MTISIVPTKVIIPKRAPGVVRRPRLIDFLHENLERKLLLVTAPAGYGKTTLIVDFAHEVDYPVCWYTLDEGDCDPNTFMAHLVSSIRQKFLKFGERSMSMSASGMIVARSAAAALVTDMVNDIPEYFVLVLDDWHLVGEDATIRELLDHLLHYLPEHAHIIVAGRTLPRGPLIRLTAQGDVAGLGPASLRFTPEEVRELLASKYDLKVNDEQATKLVEESEGWITGILLTSQAMWQGLLAGLIHAAGAPGALYDYLAGEVFDRLSPPLRRFLLESAVPRQFTARLCDDLRGVPGSDVWIDQVESRNLYLTRVETEGEIWFRYHHLFRDFLNARFMRDDPSGLARMHLRAGELFESRHQPEEAVEHFLAAGVSDRAARVMDFAARGLFRVGRTQTLLRWVELLPRELRSSAPELVLFQGQTLTERGNPEEALSVLEQAEEAFRSRHDAIGQIRAVLLRGWANHALGQFRDALRIGQEVRGGLDEVRHDQPSLKAQALRLIGTSYSGMGQWQDAEDYLTRALTLIRRSDSDERRMFNLGRLLEDLSNVLRAQGRLEEASAIQSEALALWREIGNPALLAASLNNAGYDRYLAGDYEGALTLYREAFEKAEEVGDKRSQAYMLDGIAATYRDRGEFQRAKDVYDEVIEIANEIGDQWLFGWALEGMGHVHRLIGELDRALSLFEQARRIAERVGNNAQATLSLASIGITKAEQGDVAEGTATLERTSLDLQASESHLDRARILFWLSRTYFEGGQTSSAEESLGMMLRLGNRLGCRPFSLAEGRRALAFLQWGAEQHRSDDRFRAWLNDLRTDVDALPVEAPAVRVVAPRIEVRAFGPGQVLRDGRLLSTQEWGGSAIAREMLFYLLDRAPLRKEEIGAIFWPEHSSAKMTNAFHATKYRVRRALGVEFVVYNDDRYHISPDVDMQYDVADFERYFRDAQRSPANSTARIAELERAVALYSGDYLGDVYSDWVLERRQTLQLRYFEALTQLVDMMMRRRQFERVLELCRRGFEFDYYREDIHRAFMTGLAELGRRAEALSHYKAFTRRLRKELRTSPAQETEELAARLRAQH